MRKELQHALTQESSVCHDQLQQALRHHVSQEEYADAAAHQEMEQLKQLISQQAEAMKRFESQSQQYVTQQHDEWTQKQHAQFQKFDGAIRDKDEVIQSLRQELANNKERHLQELDQALQDAQRRAQQAIHQCLQAHLHSHMLRLLRRRHMWQLQLWLMLKPYQHFTLQDFPLVHQPATWTLRAGIKAAALWLFQWDDDWGRRLHQKLHSVYLAWVLWEGECDPKDLLHQHMPSFRYHMAQEESQEQTIQAVALHLQIPVLQLPMIVKHSRQDFQFDLVDMIHQMMEVMEMTQEEIQTRMATRPPWQISISKRSDLTNHQVIQIPVEMTEVEGVEVDIKLRSRSTSGPSRYINWIFPPEFIFRRRVR